MIAKYEESFDALRQYTRDFETLRRREDLSFECDLFHETPEFLFSFDIQLEEKSSKPKPTPEVIKKKVNLLIPEKKVEKETKKFSISKLSSSEQSSKTLRKNGPLLIQFGNQDALEVDVLFLSHTWSKELSEDLFEDNDGLLVQKMIQAMKINEEKFAYGVLFLNEEVQNEMDFFDHLNKKMTDLIHSEIFQIKPKVVVCFGSILANILSGKRERISKVRGLFSKKTLSFENQDFVLSYIPVFHPEFLTINPNMKRLAWEDLQKVMELIK